MKAPKHKCPILYMSLHVKTICCDKYYYLIAGLSQNVSKNDHEMPQSQTPDQSMKKRHTTQTSTTLWKYIQSTHVMSCADPERGDRESGPCLENHKKIMVFSNTGPGPLENHKAAKPAFHDRPSSARQRNAI